MVIMVTGLRTKKHTINATAQVIYINTMACAVTYMHARLHATDVMHSCRETCKSVRRKGMCGTCEKLAIIELTQAVDICATWVSKMS